MPLFCAGALTPCAANLCHRRQRRRAHPLRWLSCKRLPSLQPVTPSTCTRKILFGSRLGSRFALAIALRAFRRSPCHQIHVVVACDGYFILHQKFVGSGLIPTCNGRLGVTRASHLLSRSLSLVARVLHLRSIVCLSTPPTCFVKVGREPLPLWRSPPGLSKGGNVKPRRRCQRAVQRKRRKLRPA